MSGCIPFDGLDRDACGHGRNRSRSPPRWGGLRATIDNPSNRNALTTTVLKELAACLEDAGQQQVGCVLISGSERWFASGADLRELARSSAVELYRGERLAAWDSIFATRTPLVASVAGLALGGGFELALACDVILAGEDARFGLPETSLGLIPGAGGTQRLTRTAGKAVAMDVVLGGRILDAAEAERHGLISRVLPSQQLEEGALETARLIAQRSPLAMRLAKEAVLSAAETGLAAGLALERQKFLLALESEQAREGIEAFLAKRQASERG